MPQEIEIRPVEGRSYAMITIREDERPAFVGIMDFSPNKHFGLAVGNRMLLDDKAAIFFLDRKGLWTRTVTKVDYVHVTDHGVAAFIDAQDLVIVDMTGEVLQKPFGPPCAIDSFEVGTDGFYIRAGRTRWRADYDGSLARIE